TAPRSGGTATKHPHRPVQSSVQTSPREKQLHPIGQTTALGSLSQPKTLQIPSELPGALAQLGAAPPHSLSSAQTLPNSSAGSAGSAGPPPIPPPIPSPSSPAA